MYPFIRLAWNLNTARRLPKMAVLDTHVSQHMCSPFDCDMFLEMNNGRILTIFEFGRFQASVRNGLWALIKDRGWGLAVAGASVRYRKRIVPFERFEQHTRLIGWDERFAYIEQAMIKTSGEVANHCLFRTAVVSNHRSVPMADVAKALDVTTPPVLPTWATNWVEADATRPWPPMQESAD